MSKMGVEHAHLDGCERAPWRVTSNLVEVLGARHRSEATCALEGCAGVVLCVVMHEGGVVQSGPIDPVGRQVVDRLVDRLGTNIHPARSMADHPEHEELPRAGRGFVADMENMSVPTVSPFLGVFVQRVQEKVMQQPEMGGLIRVKTAVLLELQEERLPFATETAGHVKPQSFNARVVHTPGGQRE